MSDHAWFCQSPEGNRGPFGTKQLLGMLESGQIQHTTQVWCEGLSNWVPAADVAKQADRPAPTAAAPEPMKAEDDYYDDIFVGLVKESWHRYRQYERASRVDEVLLGAVIASTLDNGFALIDLESAGANHYLRFEHPEDGSRTLFRLQHHAEQLQVARVIGHEARVTIGYGQRVRDFGVVWKAIKQELKGGFINSPDPGVITVDGDLSSQYIYVEVGLLWNISDYLAADDCYAVNYAKLTLHIGATLRALRKYLTGRLTIAAT